MRARIDAAALAAGRNPEDVRLLLATKTQPAELIRAALRAAEALRGGFDRRNSGWNCPDARPFLLGENRVQELVAKAETYTELVAARRAEVHLIGPLQRNKINRAIEIASAIQSVDSLPLAQAISSRVTPDAPIDVMVQVNVSAEASKSGISPDDAVALAREIAALPGLRLTGFMTIGAPLDYHPVVENSGRLSLSSNRSQSARSSNSSVRDSRLSRLSKPPDFGPSSDATPESIARTRAGYATLRQIRDEILAAGHAGTELAQELSMGMSNDLEHAIAEGATIVRVGSAVFGPRT